MLAPLRLLWRSPVFCDGLTFSANGVVVVAATTARTGTRAFSSLAWERLVANLSTSCTKTTPALAPFTARPLAGDQRLLSTSDRSRFNRPCLWQPAKGEVVELPLAAVPGELAVWDGSADGSQFLLCEVQQACYRRSTDACATQATTAAARHLWQGTMHEQRTASSEVMVTFSNADPPFHWLALKTTTKEIRTVLSAGTPPPGRLWRSVTLPTVAGVAIQAWLNAIALPHFTPKNKLCDRTYRPHRSPTAQAKKRR